MSLSVCEALSISRVFGFLFKGGMRHSHKMGTWCCDAESLLSGHSRDYYSTTGPRPPHAVDFETGDCRGNCAGHLPVSWFKDGQRLTCFRI
ncbi:hypothetical protein TNCV_4767171 [Trichonephila clavipes]|nr:hypothetical protein TNCV_4767171 [Trichonephila clavipes]